MVHGARAVRLSPLVQHRIGAQRSQRGLPRLCLSVSSDWMNMSDAATGQILWQDDDWGDLLTEREIHIPARILRCAAVSREFQFSSVEMLQGLRLEQRIFFRGNLMEGVRREAGRIMRPPPSTAAEYSRCRDQPVRLAVPSAEWYFQFGFVIPNSTNTWQQTIEAADESRMLPATALDGNVLIETSFFDDDLLVCKTVLRVFYDA